MRFGICYGMKSVEQHRKSSPRVLASGIPVNYESPQHPSVRTAYRSLCGISACCPKTPVNDVLLPTADSLPTLMSASFDPLFHLRMNLDVLHWCKRSDLELLLSES